MNEELMNKVVPVRPIGIEKVAFRADARYIDTGIADDKRKKYSFNVLYANDLDPADNVHKFPLMPENPTFVVIDSKLKLADVDLKEIPLEKQLEWLPDSMKTDIFGAYFNVDLSKRPVVRLYSNNVVQMIDGKLVTVHKIGDPMHKIVEGKESKELASITQMPVWGFLKKNLQDAYFWLKGYDPATRLDREINQGRMAYLDTLISEVHDDKGIDNTDEPEEKGGEELPSAPPIDAVG